MASSVRLGGVFLRANDPQALYRWYQEHLGLQKTEGAFAFPAPAQQGQVLFALFKQESDYFPQAQKTMLNLQVDDLDAVLDKLTAAGVTVDPKRDSYDFGKFGWCTDPEGNRIELWEPAKEDNAGA